MLMILLWVKAIHVIAMVTWFSALFYLPRLFVYHAMANDFTSIERFKIMERRLYYGIAMPGALCTLVSGMGLLSVNWQSYMPLLWMHIKLICVALLILYHLYLGQLRLIFSRDQNKHYHTFYRIINEIPTVFLILIVILTIVKPFV